MISESIILLSLQTHGRTNIVNGSLSWQSVSPMLSESPMVCTLTLQWKTRHDGYSSLSLTWPIYIWKPKMPTSTLSWWTLIVMTWMWRRHCRRLTYPGNINSDASLFLTDCASCVNVTHSWCNPALVCFLSAAVKHITLDIQKLQLATREKSKAIQIKSDTRFPLQSHVLLA